MTDALRKSIRVRCSIEHAFNTFTSKIDQWWPPGHRRFDGSRLCLEAVVGGRFFERATNGEESRLGDVLACEAPHKISYTWYPGAVSEPTLVEVRFTTDGEATVVNIVHSAANSALGELWPERVALFTRGWTLVLGAFSIFAEAERHEK